jgi:glycosyltransferase involved in cell wall biosynthesis
MTPSAESRPRVVVIMPARNSARTLEATFNGIPDGWVDGVILVDNASRDDTVAIAERLGITVVRHPVDRGYGGSVKTCLRTAVDAGADLIVELHPDNQYDPKFVPAMVEKARSGDYAIVLGSRFLVPGQARRDGMPWWRFIANRILTFVNATLLGVRLSEFHSGYRVYSAKWVRKLPLHEFSDDFKLGFETLAYAAEHRWPMAEVAISCVYHDDVSSNPLKGSIIYGRDTLLESFRVFLRRLGLGTTRHPVMKPNGSAPHADA